MLTKAVLGISTAMGSVIANSSSGLTITCLENFARCHVVSPSDLSGTNHFSIHELITEQLFTGDLDCMETE